jgi:hypothetical protein
MIVILTEPNDPHADHVSQILAQRGADFVRFDPADFPVRANLSVRYEAGGQMQSLLCIGGNAVELTGVQSVWLRRPRMPVPDPQIGDDRTRAFVADECKTFVQDLWNAIACRWLPGRPAASARGEFKASQLKQAVEVGFEIPPTLFTNSPDEFLAFYDRHGGNIVSKLIGPAFTRAFGDSLHRYTEVVSKRHVGYAASIQHCPVLLQAYVPKRMELRITVVGEKVFAVEIHSQVTHHTRHDWRRYDTNQTPHLSHALPPEVRDRCVRLVERLELCYGAIDMVLTPDGRYVFLEINPNGQYLWIEHMTGMPISSAICDFLMGVQP